MEFEYARFRWGFDDEVTLDLDVRLYLHINDVAVTLTRTDKKLRYWQHAALVQWVGVNQEYLRDALRRSEMQGYAGAWPLGLEGYGMAPSGYAA